LAFPLGRPIRNPWVILFIWGFRFWVISASLAHLFSGIYILLTGDTQPVLTLDSYGYRTANLGMTVALFIEIMRPQYIYLREPRWRRRFIFVMASTLPSIPLIFIANVQRLNGATASLFELGFDLRYPLLLLPLSLAYLILRYQTFRTASLFLLNVPVLAFAGVSASLLTALLRPSLVTPDVWDVPLFIWLFALAALCIWGGLLQSHIKNGIVWLLNHNTLGYQEIRQFSQELAVIDTHQDDYLMPISNYSPLIASVAQAIQVNYAGLWIIHEQSQLIRLYGEYSADTIPSSMLPPVDILPWTPSQSLITPQSIFFAYYGDVPTGIQQFLTGAAEVGLPLFDKEKLLGIVTLGHRYDNDIFDANEVNVMRVILSWVSLYIQDKNNARKKLEAESAKEQVRRDFNKRLDNILHDIMSGKMRQVRQNIDLAVRAKGDSTLIELQQQVAYLQQMIKNFRNLAQITESQIDLGVEINRMCGLMKGTQNVIYNGTEHSLKHALPQDLYQDLLMTATELLNNALTYAHATEIIVTLDDPDGQIITLKVDDNGIGSTQEERAQASQAGHHGVKSLQERFNIWNGQVDYTSEKGKGTHITIRVPYPPHTS
jgi:signal transduction histidine kinase